MNQTEAPKQWPWMDRTEIIDGDHQFLTPKQTKRLGRSGRRLLLAICAVSGQRGVEVQVYRKDLAKMTGLTTVRAVEGALRRLIGLGLIRTRTVKLGPVTSQLYVRPLASAVEIGFALYVKANLETFHVMANRGHGGRRVGSGRRPKVAEVVQQC